MKGTGSFLQIQRRPTMAIITASELARRYHSIVESYLNKGYNLSLFTLNGSFSGVLEYTDLISDKDKSKLIRIWVKKEVICTSEIMGKDDDVSESPAYTDAVSIIVKKYNRHTDAVYYWYSDGETISKTTFYAVKDKICYTDSIEELAACWKTHLARINNRSYALKELSVRKINLSNLPNKFIDSIMRKVNAIRGFRQATSACIQEVAIGGTPSRYGGNSSRLTAQVNVYYKGRSEHLHFS